MVLEVSLSGGAADAEGAAAAVEVDDRVIDEGAAGMWPRRLVFAYPSFTVGALRSPRFVTCVSASTGVRGRVVVCLSVRRRLWSSAA